MPSKLGCRDELGLALTFLRWVKGWTQEQLVEAAGVSLSGLRALEQGKRRQPTLKTLGPVTAALEVDLASVAEVVAFIRGLRSGAVARAAGGTEPGSSPAMTAAFVFRRKVAAAVIAASGCGDPGAAHSSREAGRRQTPKVGSGEEVGLAITFLRWIKEREQEDLAIASGVPLNVLQALEQGRRRQTPPALMSILAVLGVGLADLARVVALVRKLRRSQRVALPPRARPLEALPQAWAPALRSRLTDLLWTEVQRTSAGGTASTPVDARRQASALWPLLSDCPPEALRGLVAQVAEFQTPSFCELLCTESLRAAGDNARRTRQLAELAVTVAERAGGTEGFRSRLRGFARAHLANAERVVGDNLPAADETFERALAEWHAGAADDPGLLNAARVLSLEASLRRAQRRLPDALAALGEGLKIDRWGETPALLLGKARALIELGEFEASVKQLQQAAACIDGEREPRGLYVVEGLFVFCLCRLEQYSAAEKRLPKLRELAQYHWLDLLRVSWQEGSIAAGLGRADEALPILMRVRAEFMGLNNAYDVALVTLELAEVHAALGHTAEVKALARESAPIFQSQQVHREAQRALALFCRAAEEDRVTRELLCSLTTYLHRARHYPQLRFV
jgi:transcriptional regulator with XRE-family HTH domain